MDNNIVELAEEAITNVFNDDSVTKFQTKERLEGLKDFIEDMTDTLED